MPQVVYVGQNAEGVDLTIDGRDVHVAKGVAIDLPAAVVGRAPAPRLAQLDAELVEAYAAFDHYRIRALLDERIDVDFGEGLLQQPENWQPAPKAAPKPKDGE